MINIRTGIGFNVWDLNGPHLPELRATKQQDVLLVTGLTNENAKAVAVAEAVDPGFGEESHEIRSKRNLRVVELNAEAGRPYTLYKYFAVYLDVGI